jgi:hypothetical protein
VVRCGLHLNILYIWKKITTPPSQTPS